jgi:hypothetical protein
MPARPRPDPLSAPAILYPRPPINGHNSAGSAQAEALFSVWGLLFVRFQWSVGRFLWRAGTNVTPPLTNPRNFQSGVSNNIPTSRWPAQPTLHGNNRGRGVDTKSKAPPLPQALGRLSFMLFFILCSKGKKGKMRDGTIWYMSHAVQQRATL